MNATLARLQNERCATLRLMLLPEHRGYQFSGHPWAERIRNLHDEARCIRSHHS
ncbi:hypothetical protein S2_176 [Pseudomonas phage vB_PaeM_SCUT-S2]|uniref:Uncharacterized protein n=1 Tax=Pseudomonas phage phipa10 TaxID=2894297 RepID=A0AAE8YLC7_9CAUD|nr:hypothetical protein QE346_gp050 [Pseudomonas phage phipa10]QAU05448.1 hypothetical protein S2_176 [Pseudomonas phage vB_PaeM_SCUT-S2]UGL61678.1 hypothetical protein [Pseudomonas phage phipa10]